MTRARAGGEVGVGVENAGGGSLVVERLLEICVVEVESRAAAVAIAVVGGQAEERVLPGREREVRLARGTRRAVFGLSHVNDECMSFVFLAELLDIHLPFLALHTELDLVQGIHQALRRLLRSGLELDLRRQGE